MKERTDKLDAVTLAASLTGFHVDVIEGVVGMEISNRTLPVEGVPPVRTLPPPVDLQRVLTFFKRKQIGKKNVFRISQVAGDHILILLDGMTLLFRVRTSQLNLAGR